MRSKVGIKYPAVLVSAVLMGLIVTLGWVLLVGESPTFAIARSQSAQGVTHTVGGACGATIQACITYASTGDTVSIPSGVYTEGLHLSKAVSLVGAGAETTILRAPVLSRVLRIAGPGIDTSVVISGLTFTDGELHSQLGLTCEDGCVGAAMLITGTARPQLRNLIIQGNEAFQAGGIFAHTGSPLHIEEVEFVDNHGLYAGSGGLYAGDVVTLTNVMFRDNTAFQGSGAGASLMHGGLMRDSVAEGNSAKVTNAPASVIHSEGDLVIQGSAFANNCNNDTCSRGVFSAGALHVANSTFTDNTSNSLYYAQGGAIYVRGPARVETSTFSSNATGYLQGGAIYGESALTITASTFTSNTASIGAPYSGKGGGVFAEGPLVVRDSQFEGNSGGAIGSISPVTIRNTDVLRNVGSVGTVHVYTTSQSIAGGVLVEDSRFEENTSSALYVNGFNVAITRTHFISNTNLNHAGSGAAIYVNGPRDAHNTVDIYGGSFVNNTASDTGGALHLFFSDATTIAATSFISNTADLGGAITLSSGERLTITSVIFERNHATRDGGALFGEATHTTILETQVVSNVAGHKGGGLSLRSDDIIVRNSEFSDNRTELEPFSGDGGGAIYVSPNGKFEPVMHIWDTDFIGNYASGSGGAILAGTSAVRDLHITNGLLSGNRTGDAYSSGGAIYSNGRTTITGTHLINNRAYVDGGAVYGTLIFVDSVLVEGNVAETRWGGGIKGLQRAVNSVFRQNRSGSDGGAVWAQAYESTQYPETSSETVMITASQFDANEAGGYGGAVFSNSDLEVTDATFAGNTSAADGGAIYTRLSLDLNQVTLRDNTATRGGGVAWEGFVGGGAQPASKLNATNVLADGNQATDQGAGLHMQYGSFVNLKHLTVVDATPNNRDGIYYAGYCSNFGGCSALRVVNTIIANHAVGFHEGPVGGVGGAPNGDLDYTLFYANTRPISTTTMTFGPNSFKGDPAFVDPLNGDYHLGAGSAAVDNASALHCPDVDLEGAPRPQGLGCDRGAYEQVPQEPVLKVSPTTMSFIGLPGWNPPAAQPLTVTNDAMGTLDWTISSDQAWLSTDPAAGQGDGVVDVNVLVDGLAAGAYEGHLTVDSNALDPTKRVTITLDVLDICEPLVANGDFEYGPGVGWNEVNNETTSLIRAAADIAQYVTPRAGDWGVILGSEDGQVSELSQPVKLPGGGPLALTYYYAIASPEFGCYDDRVQVKVDGEVVADHTLCEANNTNGWVQHTVNLTRFANQEVTVSFHQENDSLGNPSVFLLDDVTFGLVDPSSCSGPQFVLNANNFSFTMQEGGNPGTETLTIDSTEGTMNWTAQESEAWLDLSATFGSTPADILLSVDTTDLVPAYYEGTITLEGTAADSNASMGVQAVQARRRAKVSLLVGANNQYRFRLIAKTGQQGLTGFGGSGGPPNATIDDTGRIAFIGQIDDQESIFSGNSVELLNLSSGFQDLDRSFGPGIMMSHDDTLITLDRGGPGGNQFYWLREWRTLEANENIIWEHVDGTIYDRYLILYGHPAVDPYGHMVFTALHLNGQHEVITAYGPNASQIYAKHSGMKPVVATDGRVVTRRTTPDGHVIVMLDYNNALKSFPFIAASSPDNFNELGHPAINDDGNIVAFYGDLTPEGAAAFNTQHAAYAYGDGSRPWIADLEPGPGVFAAVDTEAGWILVRLAGIAENGHLDPGEYFNDRNQNYVVDLGEDQGSVSHVYTDTKVSVTNPLEGSVNVAFKALAVRKGTTTQEALYVSTLDYGRNITNEIDLDRPTALTTQGPRVIVDSSAEIFSLTGKLNELHIYDALNNRSDIAFWTRTDQGTEAMVRGSLCSPDLDEIVLQPLWPISDTVPSRVMRMGTVHRHFWLLDKVGDYIPNCDLQVKTSEGKVVPVRSDEAGKVDVAIPPGALDDHAGAPTTYQAFFVDLDDAKTATSGPHTFEITVTHRSFSHRWAATLEAGFGLEGGLGFIGAHLGAKSSATAALCLYETSEVGDLDEIISIETSFEQNSSAGVTFGPQIKSSLVTGGTTIGSSGTWMNVMRTESLYDDPYTSKQRQAQAFFVLASAIENAGGSQPLLSDLVEKLGQKLGIDYRSYLTMQSATTVSKFTPLDYNVGFTVKTKLPTHSQDFKVTLLNAKVTTVSGVEHIRYPKANETAYRYLDGVKVSMDTLGLEFGPVAHTFDTWLGSSTREVQLEYVHDATTDQTRRVVATLEGPGVLKAFPNVNQDNTTVRITVPGSALPSQTTHKVGGDAPVQYLREILGASPETAKPVEVLTTDSSDILSLGLPGSIGDLSIDLGLDFQQERELLQTKGVIYTTDADWRGPGFYPTESYRADALVAQPGKSFTEIVDGILGEVWTAVKDAFTAIVDKPIQLAAEWTVDIALADGAARMDGGPNGTTHLSENSHLPQTSQASEMVVQAVAWTPEAQHTAISLQLPQLTAASGHGFVVGNIYQFSPFTLTLEPAASLTITYTEGVLNGINEDDLLIYRWEAEDFNWHPLTSQVNASTNEVTASVDRFGTFALGVDTEGPVVMINQPGEGKTFNADMPAIDISFRDLGVGVDPATVQVQLRDEIIAGTYYTSTGTFVYLPSSPLLAGSYTLIASAEDTAGNLATTERTFFVDAQSYEIFLPMVVREN